MPTFAKCIETEGDKYFYVKSDLDGFINGYANYLHYLYNKRILPIKSDPTSLDSDGDGYNDNVDPRPLVCDVFKSSLSNKDFLPIYNEDGTLDYGGDQNWFNSAIGKNGGCGTVAASNLLAYMAISNSKYKKLYNYPDLSKKNFIAHMNKVYNYVTPYSIFGVSLGVWPLSKFENGVTNYAKDHEIELKGIHKNGAFNKNNTSDYIRTALDNNLPVAMLIAINSKLRNIEVTLPNGNNWIQNSFERHWVTITEIKTDNIAQKTTLKVSTWGGYSYLDLDDYINGEQLYAALLYFN